MAQVHTDSSDSCYCEGRSLGCARDEGKKPSFLYCKFQFNCVNFLLLRVDILD